MTAIDVRILSARLGAALNMRTDNAAVSPYVRLPSGRLILVTLVRLIDHLERHGHHISIDAAGDVQISNVRDVEPDDVYALQSSPVCVRAWLQVLRG